MFLGRGGGVTQDLLSDAAPELIRNTDGRIFSEPLIGRRPETPQEASHPQIRAFSSLLTRLSSFVPTEAALRSLLGALTSEAYDDTTQQLEREQALAKQFAEILHFTLRFDELKVRRQRPRPRPRPLRRPSRPNRRQPPN